MEPVDPRSFEVFISYKNSDSEGERTRDARMAFALHDALEAKGIKAFCSTLSLNRMGQGAYKDAINQALDASKVLVVVGTTLENILSPWVKYEWGSFHDDLLTGRKQVGTMVSFISGMNPNDLPRELRGYEAFLTEQNGEELIVDFIQAALENKVKLGFAGTKPVDGRLAVIGAAAAGGLVNAEDPAPIPATYKPPKKKHTGLKFLLALILLAGCAGGYYYYQQQQALEAAQAEAERIAAEQKAAEEKAAQEAAAFAATHSDYKVQYLLKGTKKQLLDDTVVEDAIIGNIVVVRAPNIKGYTLVSPEEKRLTIAAETSENVVTFWYKKKTKPQSSSTSTSGSSGSSSSSSYTPSTGGSSSGGSSSSGSSGGSSSGGGSSKPSEPDVTIDDL